MNITNKTVLMFLSCFALILLRCEKERSDDKNIIFDPVASEKLLEESFDTILIDSVSYVLEAYLYRDFMPVSPPEGRPLVSVNCLVALDSTEIPRAINLIKQFVIYHDTIWVKDYEKDDYDDTTRTYQLCRVSNEGPMWEPGILVDVFAEIYNSKKDSTYFLRALDQCIEKIY